ncbi:uncharacterized protein BX664DRAFT_358029 [Halteromyces radiatus]|uniref:uncharacterized protein n=1 Tax=Halteromyces radiatus TaxID=101107 RepID=UPI0022207BE5|nr:uncharacterized protein BX664DRAFT_358029 [Halteromyces radiatus]KAI8093597.1 hypothetical protein BX664DRAFT_358029 [Halteromyces radiatus]
MSFGLFVIDGSEATFLFERLNGNTKCAKTPLVELRKRQIATNIEMITFLSSSSSTIKISGCEPEMEQTLKDAPNMQAIQFLEYIVSGNDNELFYNDTGIHQWTMLFS